MKSRAQVSLRRPGATRGLAEPRGDAPARVARQIEPQGAVHARDALSYTDARPGAGDGSTSGSPTDCAPDHVIQRGDDVAVPPQPGARRRPSCKTARKEWSSFWKDPAISLFHTNRDPT